MDSAAVVGVQQLGGLGVAPNTRVVHRERREGFEVADENDQWPPTGGSRSGDGDSAVQTGVLDVAIDLALGFEVGFEMLHQQVESGPGASVVVPGRKLEIVWVVQRVSMCHSVGSSITMGSL